MDRLHGYVAISAGEWERHEVGGSLYRTEKAAHRALVQALGLVSVRQGLRDGVLYPTRRAAAMEAHDEAVPLLVVDITDTDISDARRH